MKWSGVVFFVGFPLLGFLLVDKMYWLSIANGFLLKDVYCYPDFHEYFLILSFNMVIVAAPFLGAMTLLALWRFRKSGVRLSFAFAPLALFALGIGSDIAAVMSDVYVSRAHCAAAHNPELADNTAPRSPLSPALAGIATFSVYGFVASLVLVTLLGVLRRPR